MDKKLSTLLIFFVLIFSLFITFLVFREPIATFTRAKEELIPSSETSLIFAWPLTAKAGSDKININIFVRNANDLPLSNKLVTLETNLGSIERNNQTTDKSGKANFILTSQNPGISEIKAIIDNQIQLKQTVSVKFE